MSENSLSDVLVHTHSFRWTTSTNRHVILLGYIHPMRIQHHRVRINIESSPFIYTWADDKYEPILSPIQTKDEVEETFIDFGNSYRIHLNANSEIQNSLTVIILSGFEERPNLDALISSSLNAEHSWTIISPRSMDLSHVKLKCQVHSYDDPDIAISPSNQINSHVEETSNMRECNDVKCENKQVPVGSVLRFSKDYGSLVECSGDWCVARPVCAESAPMEQLVSFDSPGFFYFDDPLQTDQKTKIIVTEDAELLANKFASFEKQLGYSLKTKYDDLSQSVRLCLCKLNHISELRTICCEELKPLEDEIAKHLIKKVLLSAASQKDEIIISAYDLEKKILTLWYELDSSYALDSFLKCYQAVNRATDDIKFDGNVLQPLIAYRLCTNKDVRRKLLNKIFTDILNKQ